MAFKVTLQAQGGATHADAYVMIGQATYRKHGDTVVAMLLPYLSAEYREQQKTAIAAFFAKLADCESAVAANQAAQLALADAHAAVSVADAARRAAPNDAAKVAALSEARAVAVTARLAADAAASAAGAAQAQMQMAAEAVNAFQPLAVPLGEVEIQGATAAEIVREVDGAVVVDIAALYSAVQARVPALAQAEAI